MMCRFKAGLFVAPVAVALLWIASAAVGEPTGACPIGHPRASTSTDGSEAQHGHGPGHTHGPGHVEHAAPQAVDVLDLDMTEVFTFRPEEGETARLSYRLLEPARIQIRVKKVGTRELYLATLLNWELRQAGEHTEVWDGRDYSGNAVDMSGAMITLIAQKAEDQPGTMALEAKSPEEIVHSEEQHDHGTHHPWAEEVPHLKILEPRPRVEASDLLLIRSAVDEDRRGYGDLYGYGVRYYVDGILVQEEFYQPESEGRFAYRLDTTAFADGEHLLHIGMCDHHQHATSASVPVVFRNDR